MSHPHSSWQGPTSKNIPSPHVLRKRAPLLPPLQPLLLWQSISLFWFCGLLFLQYPWAAISLALLCCYLDTRLRTWPTIIAAVCLFIIGGTAAIATLPQRPEQPAWTMQDGKPAKVRLEGTVVRVQSLPDARLRVFLEHVRPVDMPHVDPLQGLTVWTWDTKDVLTTAEKVKVIFEEYAVKTGSTSMVGSIHRLAIPIAGQKVQITSRIRDTVAFRNVASSDFGFYWQVQGVFWRLWSRGEYGDPRIYGQGNLLATWRTQLLQRVEESLFITSAQRDSFALQGRAFLPALLMGEKFFLTQQTLDTMQAVSLLHSLALSGQHLAVAGLLAFLLVWLLQYSFAHVFLYIARPKLVGLLALPLAAVYLWLGNAPPSLLRAGCMLFIGLIFFFRYTPLQPSSILLVAVLCITAYWPLAIYTLGLQLSVLCVASICLVAPVLRRMKLKGKPEKDASWNRSICRKLQHVGMALLQIFLVSLTIQVVLLPIFLLYFPPSGVWFVANVFWLPVLGFWVLPLGILGMMLIACSWPAFAGIVLYMASLPCEGLMYILSWMQEHDLLWFSAVMRPHLFTVLAWVPLVLALALLAGRVSLQDILTERAVVPRQVRRCCVLAACLLCIAPLLRYAGYMSTEASVEILDVGQGQAVLLTVPGGHKVLVDGGGALSSRFDPGTDIVLPRLVYNAPPRVWAMIASHPDMDHIRGLMHMIPHVQMNAFYDNGEKLSKTDQELWQKNAALKVLPPVYTLSAGMEISLPIYPLWKRGEYVLEVLSPPQTTQFKGNNASLVLRLVYVENEKRTGLVMLCGDAQVKALQALLHSGKELSADVLVLSHHGAKNGLLPEFYEAVAPRVTVASAGRQNSYGHPHPSVVQALQEQKCALHTTAQEGYMKFTWNKGVFLQRSFKMALWDELPF